MARPDPRHSRTSLGFIGRGVLLMIVLACVFAAGVRAEEEPSSTTSTTVPQRAACPTLGAACGSCGPAGQCLEHLDSAPPRRVCVNGGFCVQLECATDAQCTPGQVCATLGGLSACCPPCP